MARTSVAMRTPEIAFAVLDLGSEGDGILEGRCEKLEKPRPLGLRTAGPLLCAKRIDATDKRVLRKLLPDEAIRTAVERARDL